VKELEGVAGVFEEFVEDGRGSATFLSPRGWTRDNGFPDTFTPSRPTKFSNALSKATRLKAP